MKIKTIFWIAIAVGLLQYIPLLGQLISEEFKLMLINETLGRTPSADAIEVFELFFSVVGLGFLGNIFVIFGAMSFNDIEVLKRLAFLFFVMFGFWALPDLINLFQGKPTAPLGVIVLNLGQISLLFYGYKRGKV